MIRIYKAIITSQSTSNFNFHHGTLYIRQEGRPNEFVSHFRLEFDESLPYIKLTEPPTQISPNVYKDFECEDGEIYSFRGKEKIENQIYEILSNPLNRAKEESSDGTKIFDILTTSRI